MFQMGVRLALGHCPPALLAEQVMRQCFDGRRTFGFRRFDQAHGTALMMVFDLLAALRQFGEGMAVGRQRGGDVWQCGDMVKAHEEAGQRIGPRAHPTDVGRDGR